MTLPHLVPTARRRAAVAVGGAAGTGLRAGVAAAVPLTATGWPWATFVVNLSGAFVLGYLLTRLQEAARPTTVTVPLLCTGLLGSFSTFSTFVVEVGRLAHGGRAAVALGYAVASVAAGSALARVGVAAAERGT